MIKETLQKWKMLNTWYVLERVLVFFTEFFVDILQ